MAKQLLILFVCFSAVFAAEEEVCADGESATQDRSLIQKAAFTHRSVQVTSAPDKKLLKEAATMTDPKKDPLKGLSAALGSKKKTNAAGVPIKTGPEPDDDKVSDDDGVCEKAIFARPDLCPDKCPYAAEMTNQFCHFRCVKAKECGLHGTVKNASIPSDKLMTCRHCNVAGCSECVAAPPGSTGSKFEQCVHCMPGYTLNSDGKCDINGQWIWITIVVVVACLVPGVLWYFYVMVTKPQENTEGIDAAMESRNRQMLSEQGEDGELAAYPLTTNLCGKDVAGPGTTVYFRFQAALLIWGGVLFTVWMGFAIFVSTDLLQLGNREAKSPQILCAVIHWGRGRQIELLWTKVYWLVFAWIFSFLGATYYAVTSTMYFTQYDDDHDTMSDFAARLEGFPRFRGTAQVEVTLKEIVERTTGQEVVGVSIGWDYSEEADEVQVLTDQQFLDGPPARPTPEEEAQAGLHDFITDQVLDAWEVDMNAAWVSEAQAKRQIGFLESTSSALVVFNTQEARDRAVATSQNGIQIHGAMCSLKIETYEPEAVHWENFSVSKGAKLRNVVGSYVLLLVSCIVWSICLFYPYAIYMSSFSYANGDKPGMLSKNIFSILVVLAQLGLFVASKVCSELIGWRYEDSVQKTYTALYTMSVLFELGLTVSLLSYLSYKQMVGIGAHTATGTLLRDLDSYQHIFESYPMQKSIGNLLFQFCFPATFLVPFICEPLGICLLPLFCGRFIVGGNKRVKGMYAEKALRLGDMEQGRYGDVVFNAILCSLVSFVAPAYIHMIFGVFFLSHLVIYAADQYKVLRFVQKFTLSSPSVHKLAMQLFVIPVGLLAGATLFKWNQMHAGEHLGSGPLTNAELYKYCGIATLGSVLLQLLMLEIVTGCFGGSEGKAGGKTYSEVATDTAATYFSTNKVHCLRSKYIYGHSPAQAIYAAGQEHRMQANPEIGSFFAGHLSKVKKLEGPWGIW
eukprot:TRINITY_DN4943_c0_g2_i1.p1 TRINITY_DN4943_c0_g2~~TRINITY_DN4943_c0_g2_i1.p1  ORF type:complete len:964 (-),score=183.11 TRINITY_DN4943_c0_g2_i1:158-3049(-)